MKKAILIVSFGTTYPDTRQKNIAAITRQVRALYPDAVVEEAVSSTIVRNAMKKREHIEAKSPTEALESMKKQGVTHVAVFPTHVIDGIENHRLKEAAKNMPVLSNRLQLPMRFWQNRRIMRMWQKHCGSR